MRKCLECAFEVEDAAVRTCPKCDAVLRQQTDGSVATIDIAHHEETGAQALAKLRGAVTRHGHRPTRELRVIVGTGKIRDLALSALAGLQARGAVRAFAFEPRNRGSILVRLKK